MTSILDHQPPKIWPSPIKIGVNWVPGTLMNLFHHERLSTGRQRHMGRFAPWSSMCLLRTLRGWLAWMAQSTDWFTLFFFGTKHRCLSESVEEMEDDVTKSKAILMEEDKPTNNLEPNGCVFNIGSLPSLTSWRRKIDPSTPPGRSLYIQVQTQVQANLQLRSP